MFSEKEKGYLIDILQACELIIEHTYDITFDSFMKNQEKTSSCDVLDRNYRRGFKKA